MITLLWNKKYRQKHLIKFDQNNIKIQKTKSTEYVLRSTNEGKEIIENLSKPHIYLSDYIDAYQDLNWKA